LCAILTWVKAARNYQAECSSTAGEERLAKRRWLLLDQRADHEWLFQ